MSVALPLVASAQRIDGAIGVSLVILPPTAARTVAVTAFHVDRDGLATIRATAPRAPGPSPVVMTRVVSSADGFLPTRYVPALPCAPDGATRELRYRIDVRGSADGGAPRDVHLRMEYVVVAGT